MENKQAINMNWKYTKENPLRVVWRSLKNYPGYSVSNTGLVRSDPKKIWNGKGWYMSQSKHLKPNTLKKGYYQVDLKVEKRRHPRQVHRLVAEAFIPNPNNYPQVNHKNGIKNDNRVENLEWCDNSMNQIHAYNIGLQKKGRNVWKTRTKAKIPIDRFYLNGEFDKRFDSIADALRDIGETKTRSSTLYHIVKGYNKTKIYKGYIYELAI